ncbi:MAG: amino acid ABC transporter substrate-binding protein [Paraglaciecola sp.]|nr:amino acid ABC transporter substrate-binding protein [Paraglaciecola sp.]NCT49731.1 amino acid ABC transporter substrate-binding protein [Paraglaciecola sp.]
MKNRCLLLAMFCSAKLLIANCVAKELPVLSMGFDHSPPYNYKDEQGQAKGSLVTIAKQLGKEAGVRIEFVFCPWARCVSLVKHGKIDLLAGLSQSAERERDLLFLKPAIFNASSAFAFYQVDTAISIATYADLRKLVIGKLRGSQHFAQFDSDTSLTVVEAPDVQTLFALLQNGRIDTFIHMRESIVPYLEEYDTQHRIQQADYVEVVSADGYLVLSKHSGKTALATNLSDGLATLKQNNVFATLKY